MKNVGSENTGSLIRARRFSPHPYMLFAPTISDGDVPEGNRRGGLVPPAGAVRKKNMGFSIRARQYGLVASLLTPTCFLPLWLFFFFYYWDEIRTPAIPSENGRALSNCNLITRLPVLSI